MHHNHQAIINMFGGLGPLCLSFEPNDTIEDLKVRLAGMTHIDMVDQRISTLGGRPLQDEDLLFNDPEGPVIFNFSLRLRGGKGGFGSMLRAQGGRMNAQKTTNFEACRDLQGRRIRTVNDAKRREEALAALPEAERERQERIQKKIDEGLKEREPKKFRFDDNQFLEDREEVMESVKNAVSKALKQQPIMKTKTTKAPAVSLLFDDEMSDDDDDEEEDENEDADAAYGSDSRSSEQTAGSSAKQESTKTATTSEAKGKGKGKGKGKATVTQSTSSSNNNDDDDEDEETQDPKKVLSEFMGADYGDEYDSEEDEDFVDDEEEDSSEEEVDDEEDFDAEEDADEEDEQPRSKKAATGSSSSQNKGKGKQTRKRKEREE